MSTGLLFAIGTLVTVLVSIGVALPIYGAILDGRYQAEHQAAEVRRLSEERPGHRPAA
jgi:hypothetical protein